jgi:O6-methylguanine-DNA--protein-cysteine methyltransferase
LVPCHRVLGSAGLGGFTGGIDMKQDLLACEAR